VSVHRAAWALRAGLTAALVAGVVATAATPAHADPQLHIDNVGTVQLQVGGGSQTVNLRVVNQAAADEENTATGVTLTLTTPLDNRGVHIASAASGCSLGSNNTRMDCNIGSLGPGENWTGVIQLAVHGNSNIPPGQTQDGTAQIVVSATNTSAPPRSFTVRLRGPEEAPRVTEVSGILTDIDTGEPIPNATVQLVDGEEQTHSVGTNDNGEFRFRDMDIAPGTIGLRARKEGYEGETFTRRAEPGDRITDIRLVAKSTASPSPSASPSGSPTPTPSGSASAAPPPPADDGGSTFFTTLMVTLGVILVLAGIGAIVFMVWRRRQEEDDDGYDDADDPISGPRGPRPPPGGRGAYRPSPTQVMGDAPTQITRPGGGPPLPAVGPRPALADAPTMLLGAAGAAGADQTTVLPRQIPPSPHSPGSGGPTAPRPPAPGYGQPGQPGYGSPAAPSSGGYSGAYGSPAAPGAPSGYSGPTAGYGNPATSGYGSSGGGYAADQPTYGGYGTDQPTGRHGHSGHGYDRPEPASGGGYGPDPYTRPASPAPGYGQPGYGQPGYGQPGYEQPGYDPAGQHRAGGGETPGYDGGYRHADHGGRPAYPPQSPGQPGTGGDYYDDGSQRRARHSEPADRRRLDWLDD
jgi:hypothetical protein